MEAAGTLVPLIGAAELVSILPVNVNDLAIRAAGIGSLVALSLHICVIAAEGLVAVCIHPDFMPAVAFDVPKLAISARTLDLHLARADEVLWPLPAVPLLGSWVDIDDLILLLVADQVATVIARIRCPI